MKCPKCDSIKDVVRETRESADHALVRRRRQCEQCSARFTTYERVDSSQLVVLKRDGGREMFDLSKVRRGVAAALENLEEVVNPDALEELVNDVAASLRPDGQEVTSAAVGQAVEDHLRLVSHVAFARFASVHRRFSSADDFARLIEDLGEPGLSVVKRDGVRIRPFSRQKIVDGIRWAVNGTAIEDQAEEIADGVIAESVRDHDVNVPIPTDLIGESVRDRLRQRDAVAFVRFSSVFKRFMTVQDFTRLLAEMGVEGPLRRRPDDRAN